MTLKQFYRLYSRQIDSAIESALREDCAAYDISTGLVLKGNEKKRVIVASLLCKERCILSGIEIFKKVFRKIDPDSVFTCYANDGDLIRNKKVVLKVRSKLSSLLAGERTALNFIQRMSGIATLTNYFVKNLRFKGSKILHTRKTTPNFRYFELAAVKTGGGDFHRVNLSSAVMIKDNHICATGSIENILMNLKKMKKPAPVNLEIEVKTIKELDAVIQNGEGLVRVVMLDNFDVSKLKNAIRRLKLCNFEIEISGGIDQKNFKKKQLKGVDYYSIGMITHSYKSVDFSLEF